MTEILRRFKITCIQNTNQVREETEMAAKKAVYLEVNADQYDLDQVMDKAVKDYQKNNKAALKNIDLYVKPEDGKAYYVVNDGKVTGSVDL
ncbi:MAG: DUF6465 family protein [Lachnospiraceae bacterium]